MLNLGGADTKGETAEGAVCCEYASIKLLPAFFGKAFLLEVCESPHTSTMPGSCGLISCGIN